MAANHLHQERVSFITSVTKQADKDVDGFKDTSTPLDLEDGALREGGALVYTSPEVMTLLFQYAVVGICYGGLTGMRLPVLTYYFGLEAAALSSATGLMNLGWSFKVFYGMLSDCFPIMGYSRKPYILIGWLMTAICFVVIALKPAGPSVVGDKSVENIKAAQANGSLLVLLCSVACFCYIMADVACDAMVVEYAQREPDRVRGRLQSSIYGTRFVFQAVSTALSGFLMSSERYGGKFGFDISVNAFFGILAVPVVANVFVVYFFMKDRKRGAIHFAAYFHDVFELIQKRAVWQVMIFNFMFNLFSAGISSWAGSYIQVYWAHVEPVNSSVAGVLSYFILSSTFFAVGRWGTHWNWRVILVITTLTGSVIDAIAQFLTIYDIVRNQWFYLGIPLTEQFPLGIQFVVSTYVIVELAGDGNEGLMYGLLTTVANLPTVFGSMITNVYSTQLKVTKADIETDTAEVRNDAAYSFLVVYATTVIACCWTVILPPRKAAVKEMLQHGGKYPIIGALIIVVTFGILCISVTSIMMTMFESTSCYLLAGGSGC
ncbi:hypothetical protein H257_14890 [Aphanomyces astaci]|uniref:Folate-Biopterin Transporter (FBT) Family n=1 Tax=Aphanomyces astaci TaxID=112090 RepID=W4FP22_APHAT|nr:hypothetical protein H257_14890 [Aphanomyces astaci]ETV69247.1 hypothetical protein H257_14890 [Aphanomyces astaci]RQM28826.1 hypothetical protein B5M09_006704 [Aphanomyces astaci]|eukprot:XP_009841104.1 hypothetical protein H257_14890 [Aphanomyces astaci]